MLRGDDQERKISGRGLGFFGKSHNGKMGAGSREREGLRRDGETSNIRGRKADSITDVGRALVSVEKEPELRAKVRGSRWKIWRAAVKKKNWTRKSCSWERGEGDIKRGAGGGCR